jgi:hypothetical protein
MASLYVIVGLAVLLPLSGLVDLMLTSQRYDVSAGQQAATTSERIAAIEHLFYQALASYVTAQQASSTKSLPSTTTSTCPVFGATSDLQPAPLTGLQTSAQLSSTQQSSALQTLDTGCSYVSKSSATVRLEVKLMASSFGPATSLALDPKTIVITQACVVTTPQESCLSPYSP